MKRKNLAVLAALAVGAAAWGAEPVAIAENDLYRYWRPAGGIEPVRQAQVRGVCERSTVRVSYVVGADGLTRDVEVLNSSPLNSEHERQARRMVTGARFTPAPDNDARQAVQLTETYRFECSPRL